LTEIANRVILASLLEWCLMWCSVTLFFGNTPLNTGTNRSSIEFQIYTV
jgi:hypothetical protein